MKNSTKWLWSFNLVFIVLLSISMPFKYNVLFLNKYIVTFFDNTTKFLGNILGFYQPNYTLKLYSDSTGLYLHTIVVFLFSLLFAFSIRKKPLHKIKTFIYTYSSYYLALQMLIYGFNKVFKWQFYDAPPNILYTPVGFLTKDFLYWTSMGSSYLYSIITGLAEVLIGTLLLFKKTRHLGFFLGLFITLHIVVINFSFDINVKIQSLFLLSLFIILNSENFKIFYSFFIKKEKAALISCNDLKIKKQFYTIIKTVTIFLIFTEALYPYFYINNFNGDLKTKPPFYGAYNITNHKIYKRFFIHSDPYLIIQDKKDKLYSFPFEYTTNGIKLKNQKSFLVFKNDTLKSNEIKIDGSLFGYPLKFNAKKIDLSKSPIYKDDFHWTIDSYQKEE